MPHLDVRATWLFLTVPLLKFRSASPVIIVIEIFQQKQKNDSFRFTVRKANGAIFKQVSFVGRDAIQVMGRHFQTQQCQSISSP